MTEEVQIQVTTTATTAATVTEVEHSKEEPYNSVNVLNSFKNCIMSDGVTIDMVKFLDAYKELVKFFDQLGKLFTFVAADLIDKFQNIEKCMTNDGENNNYVTVQRALDYEKEAGIYMVNHNATLSLLRLIRGLEFIRKILENLYQNQDNGKKSYELAGQAYDATLAFRHRWTVRKLVKAGFYLLPRKNDLINIMLMGTDPANGRKENDIVYQEVLGAISKVHSIIYKIYEQNDFLELVLA